MYDVFCAIRDDEEQHALTMGTLEGGSCEVEACELSSEGEEKVEWEEAAARMAAADESIASRFDELLASTALPVPPMEASTVVPAGFPTLEDLAEVTASVLRKEMRDAERSVKAIVDKEGI